jgi:molecular chaperone GrpE
MEKAELEEALKKKESDYLYLYAEFENYKKRCTHEQSEIYRFGWAPLALDLLDVADSLEKALRFASESNESAVLEGVQITLNQLRTILERHGIQRLETSERSFDPNLHDATAFQPSNLGKNQIISEESPGYTLHGRLLRPSRVVVSSGQLAA